MIEYYNWSVVPDMGVNVSIIPCQDSKEGVCVLNTPLSDLIAYPYRVHLDFLPSL